MVSVCQTLFVTIIQNVLNSQQITGWILFKFYVNHSEFTPTEFFFLELLLLSGFFRIYFRKRKEEVKPKMKNDLFAGASIIQAFP